MQRKSNDYRVRCCECLSSRASKHSSSNALRRRRRRREDVISRSAADEDVNKDPLSSLNTAIELRSRLQDISLIKLESSESNAWTEIRDKDGKEILAHVYEPNALRTWGYVHFVGGAVLGNFPHVCYDAVLREVSNRTGVTVVATPFELTTKHGEIAKRCERKFRRSLKKLCVKDGVAEEAKVPVFQIAHSLGCKILVVSQLWQKDKERMDEEDEEEDKGEEEMYAKKVINGGHFLMAFNNASATDSIKIIEKFAKEILQKRAGVSDEDEEDAADKQFETIFDRLVPFAEVAAKAAGLDFVPNATEVLEGVRAGKFTSPRVTLCAFTNDELDQSESLREALSDGKVGLTKRREIPGDHMSPILLDLDKYASMNPALLGRLSGIKIGDDKVIDNIVDEICEWLKSPS